MSYIRKLIKDNNIKNYDLYAYLNIPYFMFERKTGLRADFTINELVDLKNYFVNLGILTQDFDIGDFLNEV